MEISLKIKLLHFALKLAGYLLIVSRVFYRSKFASAKTGLILLIGYAILLISVLIDAQYFLFFGSFSLPILALAFCPVLLLCGYLLLGQFCSGIVKIDCGAETGISFSQSMQLCQQSFRFLGVGAAKLTEKDEIFRSMVSRCVKNGNNTPKLLLCDLQSPVISKLEGLASVPNHRFSGKIKKSYSAISSIEKEMGTKLDIKKYYAKDYDHMPLFRLMFIDEKYCLVAGGYYGQDDHGIAIPQLFLSRNIHPALYGAFDRYYKQFSETLG